MEHKDQLPLENLVQVNIEEEMKKSYLDYAMSVIVGRALPDARDGLKPVHRRILFAMNEMGNVHNKAYKKSARIVGDVIGKYHPHGDMAVYDAIVRMVQDFSMRYPLVDGQGNFGSVDGDSPAAMRYTEIRMARIAGDILADIDKETVNFLPNYDESLQEPEVMPTRIPNLLVNGSSGIAVGMATNIPPHNLGEIVDALIHLIGKPEAPIEELMRLVPGPDFPTAGFIYGRAGIRDAYLTGRGHPAAARPGRGGRIRQGARGHRRHRDPLPGQQEQAHRADRQPGQGQEDRRHHRHPGRVRPRGHAHRHRAAARRRARDRPEQPLQAHPHADQLRRDPAGHRPQPAEAAEPEAGPGSSSSTTAARWSPAAPSSSCARPASAPTSWKA